MKEITDQEKSSLLAKAMGWTISGKIKDQFGGWFVRVQEPGDDWELLESVDVPFDLYTPANMVLAKYAIAWGYINNKQYREWLDIPHQAVGILVGEDGIRLALDNLIDKCNQQSRTE